MSSHHIVRDNQEPALLFLDSDNCNSELLNQLLEWSPFIIATEDSNTFLKIRDVKPDVILSSNSSMNENIERAFEILIKGEHEGVNIFTSIDNQKSFIDKNIQVSVFSGKWKWTFIKSGILKKWFPAETQLKILEDQRVYISDQKGDTLDINQIVKEGLISFQSKQGFWLGEKII